jgi:hypothetical protein
MNIKKHFFALAVMSLAASNVMAENIQFQNIRVGGTGCPSDVTQIATAPDLSSASLIFQGFESHVPTPLNPKGGGTSISLLNCNVFLDIKLPAGQKLESIEISYDMRGNAMLDRGVSGSFKSYLISSSGFGSERTQQNQLLQEKSWMNISNDQEEDFLIQTTKVMPISSQCGMGQASDRVSLHLQHQLGSQILSGDSRTQGTITMDSSDMKGGIRIRANTSICRAAPGGGQPPVPPGRNCRVVRVGGRAQMICQ